MALKGTIIPEEKCLTSLFVEKQTFIFILGSTQAAHVEFADVPYLAFVVYERHEGPSGFPSSPAQACGQVLSSDLHSQCFLTASLSSKYDLHTR